MLSHFNPRSREGSDSLAFSIRVILFISIHAPAKGATFKLSTALTFPEISIHAPAKGATKEHTEKQADFADFNPRSREGSDKLVKYELDDSTDFNPRSREGSDSFFIFYRRYAVDFNPRSREGSDIFATESR